MRLRASLIAYLVKDLPSMQETRFDSWVGKIHWRRNRLPTPVFLGFSCGSAGKESVCNVGDLSLISGLKRSPGEEKGYPFQYSGLENSIDCIVHGVAKGQTRLSDFHFTSLHLWDWAFDLNARISYDPYANLDEGAIGMTTFSASRNSMC